MSHRELDELENLPTNLTDNEPFQKVVDRVVSRRGLLKTGVGLSAAMFLGGVLSACGGSSSSSRRPGEGAPPKQPELTFEAVAASTGNEIVVPAGYRSYSLLPWGTALFADSLDWQGDASETGEDQGRQVGDNHDGMHFFAIPGTDSSREGVLVFNNEYTNPEYLYDQAALDNWSHNEVLKGQNTHGITIAHIRRNAAGKWDLVKDSRYNRRITPARDDRNLAELTGPAATDPQMQSLNTPHGLAYGTINNCGNGYTPWGTYLTCEENFNQYFGSSAGDVRDASMKRYGVGAGSGWNWHEHDERWDIAKDPNHTNLYGWIVEIDPLDPESRPLKRTALGRFKHENAALTIGQDGRVVVYMGDDQANDYIYKFVSDGIYDPNNQAANRNLLESGKLYVARFMDGEVKGDMMGDGEWILLDKDANEVLSADDRFPNQAAVLIHARLAADAVGATPMDRPEWVAVHPFTQEVYCTLTNNSGRKAESLNDANPRAANRYGQIVRWREANGDPSSVEPFEWDLFVLAGNPDVHPYDLRRGSSNVNRDNTFNSPDGLAFDDRGLLWIQTDGNYSNSGDYAGQGNNQMLVANVETGEIRRFLVGPDGCEVTGITWTPDGKTLFINIQHPGEVGSHPNKPDLGEYPNMDALLMARPDAFSSWPHDQPSATGKKRPRSSVVVIEREDGGVIGA